MTKLSRLSEIPHNQKARIIHLDNNEKIRNRLNSMGLSIGVIVEVLTGSSNSNYLIGTGHTRIGLEPVLAQAIKVQLLTK